MENANQEPVHGRPSANQETSWYRTRRDSGKAARAFISYSSQDKAVADSVCQALELAGVPCWIAPRDVVLGGSYAGEIVHAIDATKLLILILSKNSAESKHVLREVERASSKGHSVVGFKIDMAPISADLEYFLNTSQWLDASAQGVERSLPRLVDAVQRVIAPPSQVGVVQGRLPILPNRHPLPDPRSASVAPGTCICRLSRVDRPTSPGTNCCRLSITLRNSRRPHPRTLSATNPSPCCHSLT